MMMKQKTFMDKLKKELSSLPKKEEKDILLDYEEYFSEGKRRKRSEEDIAKNLGDPKKIGKSLCAEYHIKIAKEKPSVKSVIRAVLAFVSVGLFNAIIVIGPLAGLIAVLVSLYAVVLSLAVSGAVVFFASFILIFVESLMLGLSLLFASIAVLALGVLLFLGVNFITKWFIKGLVGYLKLNVKIVKGDQE